MRAGVSRAYSFSYRAIRIRLFAEPRLRLCPTQCALSIQEITMAKLDKDKIRSELLGDVYASTDLGAVIPKDKIPDHEHAAEHAYQVVHDELMMHGNSRPNLATFCQTWLDDEIHKIIDECIDKNMIGA
jgi:glutamate/tyrosine decarboxylase-like PLP-dependent enzyme